MRTSKTTAQESSIMGYIGNKYFSMLFLLLGVAVSAWGISVQELYPANGATNQCLDTPLRMMLSGKPHLNWGGSVRIRDLDANQIVHTWSLNSAPGDPMTTNVAASWAWKDAVGHTNRNVWPIVVDSIPGHLAEIRVPNRLLQPGKRYQIEVDGGVLRGADGSNFPGIAAGAWIFTTRATSPITQSSVIVAQDNSGDVCSIQEGVALVPSASTSPVHVLVKPGYYREMVASKGKDFLRIYGAGTGKTFVRYYNSNNLNEGSSLRNLVLLEGKEAHVRALTLTNTVIVTGSQAEALYLRSDKAVVADVVLQSHQDTWLNSGGRAYVENSTIEGSVDFVWGYNPVFFRNCDIVFTRTGSVVVQPRNPGNTHGYVFDRCQLRAKSAQFTGNKFARDAGASYPDGEVVWLNTTIHGNIMATSPWTIGTGMDANRLRFCEYKSRDQNGNLINITDAQRRDHQCSDAQATELSQPASVLDGWSPTLPPLSEVFAMVPSDEIAQPILQLISGAASQTVQEGNAIIPIVYTWGGSATGVTVSGLPAGLSGAVSGSNFTITGSPTSAGNFTVRTEQSSGTAITLAGSIFLTPLLHLKIPAIQACAWDGVEEASNAGFEESAYLNLENTLGASASYVVDVQESQSVRLVIRFANGGVAARPMQVFLNQSLTGEFAFAQTGGWTTWHTEIAEIPLAPGRAEIRLQSTTSDGGPNLDWLGFSAAGLVRGSCDIPTPLYPGLEAVQKASGAPRPGHELLWDLQGRRQEAVWPTTPAR